MKRKVDKEQFFTTKENAEFCLSKLNIEEFDTIIEPSAGEGSFSSLIPECLAYDIEPKADGIIKADFLKEEIEINGKVLTVGNPPFGRQSSLAVAFINKAARFSDKIAFILPLSFKKNSVINKLDKHVFLNNVYELPNTVFYFGNEIFVIPCAFFVFDVIKDKERQKKKKPQTSDFTFVKQEQADNSIRRVGFYSGRIEGVDVSPSSHYFVKWNTPQAKEKFSSLVFSFGNTVGPRSLSMSEMIDAYNNS